MLRMFYEPPADIRLAGERASRARESMMIVMSALAHADEPGTGDVVTLTRRDIDDKALLPHQWAKWPDQPVGRLRTR